MHAHKGFLKCECKDHKEHARAIWLCVKANREERKS